MKTRFKSPSEFLEAFNEDLPQGGLFCPTTTELVQDDPVLVELHFPGLPNKMLMRGHVLWWRSALPRLRVRAGAMVTFTDDEHDKKEFLLRAAQGEHPDAIKRRHPRIPVELEVHWRRADAPEVTRSVLRDISIGGALLVTDADLQEGAEIIVEVTTPGGASPIPIAGKVTYRVNGGCGVKFTYRDGGGSQRLREVVRRLVALAP